MKLAHAPINKNDKPLPADTLFKWDRVSLDQFVFVTPFEGNWEIKLDNTEDLPNIVVSTSKKSIAFLLLKQDLPHPYDLVTTHTDNCGVVTNFLSENDFISVNYLDEVLNVTRYDEGLLSNLGRTRVEHSLVRRTVIYLNNILLGYGNGCVTAHTYISSEDKLLQRDKTVGFVFRSNGFYEAKIFDVIARVPGGLNA